MTERAYIGIGGNVGAEDELRDRLRAAAGAVGRLPAVRSTQLSPMYRTGPVGPVRDQPDFVNAVIAADVEPGTDPVAFLAALLDIEHRFGRRREDEIPMGPRTLDLDLLTFGDRVLDDPGPPHTIVPHPRLAERDFVLRPLFDLAGPDWTIPGTRTRPGGSTR